MKQPVDLTNGLTSPDLEYDHVRVMLFRPVTTLGVSERTSPFVEYRVNQVAHSPSYGPSACCMVDIRSVGRRRRRLRGGRWRDMKSVRHVETQCGFGAKHEAFRSGLGVRWTSDPCGPISASTLDDKQSARPPKWVLPSLNSAHATSRGGGLILPHPAR